MYNIYEKVPRILFTGLDHGNGKFLLNSTTKSVHSAIALAYQIGRGLECGQQLTFQYDEIKLTQLT